MAEKTSRPSLEEENQIAQMSQLSLSPSVKALKATIQTGPLFIPGIVDGLIKIINHLDPVSFLRFTRTCKPVHSFCYNTKEIQVQFGRHGDGYTSEFQCSVSVSSPFISETRIEFFLFNSERRPRFKAILDEDMENLLKLPFVFTIRKIRVQNDLEEKIDPRALEKLSSFLRRFHRIRLIEIYQEIVDDWNAFAQFIQEFGSQLLTIEHWNSVPIPLELLPIFMNKVGDFQYHGQVPDDLILSATAKCLYLFGAEISLETFQKLLKRFHAGSIVCWTIGRGIPEGLNADDEDGYKDRFMGACSEVMQIVITDDIDF